MIDKKENSIRKDEMVETKDVKLGQLSRDHKPYLGILIFPYNLQSIAIRQSSEAVDAGGEPVKAARFF